MPTAIISLLNVLGGLLTSRGHGDLGQYARLAASLVREGDDGNQAIKDLVLEMENMVDEHRDPTEEEVEDVRQRRKNLSDAIQAGAGDGEDDPDDDDAG